MFSHKKVKELLPIVIKQLETSMFLTKKINIRTLQHLTLTNNYQYRCFNF